MKTTAQFSFRPFRQNLVLGFALALALLQNPFRGWAQTDPNSGNVFLIGGVQVHPWSSDADLKAFQKGYNNYWSSALDKKFAPTLPAWDVHAGVQYWLTNRVGFQLASRYSRHGYTVRFKSGEKRDLDLRVRTPLEFGLLLGNPNKLSFLAGFGFGTSRMVSIFSYPDGTQSLNYDSNINGVFSANGFSWRLEAYLKLYKNLQLVAALAGVSGSEYTDKNSIRGIDSRLGAYETVFFPKDYSLYQSTATSGASYDYPFDQSAKLRYTTVSLGLVYRIRLFHISSGF
jgi:hypothetical protein